MAANFMEQPAACRMNPDVLAGLPNLRLADRMHLQVSRPPVLTLWTAVVAERLGHPAATALTLGRAVAGSSARLKSRNSGKRHKAEQGTDAPQPAVDHETPVESLFGKVIRLLLDESGELRAAMRPNGTMNVFLPINPASVQSYLENAFGNYPPEVRIAMETQAARYEPAELNGIGFKLYERFRPEVANHRSGRWAKAALYLDIENILNAN